MRPCAIPLVCSVSYVVCSPFWINHGTWYSELASLQFEALKLTKFLSKHLTSNFFGGFDTHLSKRGIEYAHCTVSSELLEIPIVLGWLCRSHPCINVPWARGTGPYFIPWSGGDLFPFFFYILIHYITTLAAYMHDYSCVWYLGFRFSFPSLVGTPGHILEENLGSQNLRNP